MSAPIDGERAFLITGGFSTEEDIMVRKRDILEFVRINNEWTIKEKGQMKHPRGDHVSISFSYYKIGKPRLCMLKKLSIALSLRSLHHTSQDKDCTN